MSMSQATHAPYTKRDLAAMKKAIPPRDPMPRLPMGRFLHGEKIWRKAVAELVGASSTGSGSSLPPWKKRQRKAEAASFNWLDQLDEDQKAAFRVWMSTCSLSEPMEITELAFRTWMSTCSEPGEVGEGTQLSYFLS